MTQIVQNYFHSTCKILKSSCAIVAYWGIIFSLFTICPLEMKSAQKGISDTSAHICNDAPTKDAGHCSRHCVFENNKQAAQISLRSLECISNVEKISRIQINALITTLFKEDSLEISKLDSDSELFSLHSSPVFSAYTSIHAIRTVILIV